uniref:Serine/threonine-protein kinase STY46 isoform X2 n=1 Tax=Rhizophora mucronata TaxID=61149 RepID=A0A2P2J9R0_RHIMU
MKVHDQVPSQRLVEDECSVWKDIGGPSHHNFHQMLNETGQGGLRLPAWLPGCVPSGVIFCASEHLAASPHSLPMHT